MSAPTTSRATATRKRAPKPPPEPVTVQALCDTCYDVHPVRLTTTCEINDADLLGNLHGACPVCQRETFHLLVRATDDPRCDRREREAEAERIAQDAELTWHLTELQRLGVRIDWSDEAPEYAAQLLRWLDDGTFVLFITDGWATASHGRKLDVLREVRERVDAPSNLHRWGLHVETDDCVAWAGIGWPK